MELEIENTLKRIGGIHSYEQILSNFENFELVETTNSEISTSIVISAGLKQTGTKFILKIFNMELDKSRDANLKTEVDIYNELSKLVKYEITPNILFTYLAGELPDFNTTFFPNLDKELQLKIKERTGTINRLLKVPDELEWTNTGIILTKMAQKTFQEEAPNLTNEELRTILFQMYYTLYVFEKFRISHGDLHVNNIFIETIEPTVYTFKVDNKQYIIEITKLVKIFDFDRAMIERDTKIDTDDVKIKKVFNPIREDKKWACRKFGECNVFNRNLDHVIFKTNLETQLKLPLLEERDYDIFMRDIYGKFNNNDKTIGETYKELLVPGSQELIEFNRLYKKPSDEPYDKSMFVYRILNLPWKVYSNIISKVGGRTIRDPAEPELNHLWIPSNIIPCYKDILNHKYFKPYLLKKTKYIYSLNNRIVTI